MKTINPSKRISAQLISEVKNNIYDTYKKPISSVRDKLFGGDAERVYYAMFSEETRKALKEAPAGFFPTLNDIDFAGFFGAPQQPITIRGGDKLSFWELKDGRLYHRNDLGNNCVLLETSKEYRVPVDANVFCHFFEPQGKTEWQLSYSHTTDGKPCVRRPEVKLKYDTIFNGGLIEEYKEWREKLLAIIGKRDLAITAIEDTLKPGQGLATAVKKCPALWRLLPDDVKVDSGSNNGETSQFEAAANAITEAAMTKTILGSKDK